MRRGKGPAGFKPFKPPSQKKRPANGGTSGGARGNQPPLKKQRPRAEAEGDDGVSSCTPPCPNLGSQASASSRGPHLRRARNPVPALPVGQLLLPLLPRAAHTRAARARSPPC